MKTLAVSLFVVNFGQAEDGIKAMESQSNIQTATRLSLGNELVLGSRIEDYTFPKEVFGLNPKSTL